MYNRVFSPNDFQILNFDVGKKLYELSKLGGRWGGNLDNIQKNSSFFLQKPSLIT